MHEKCVELFENNPTITTSCIKTVFKKDLIWLF